MKHKKLLSLLLSLAMMFALASCSGGSADAPAEPAAETPAESTPAAPAETPADTGSDETYVLSFASSKATGSNRNVMVEEVLKAKLEEKSGGRLTIEIYPSNTLVGAKEMYDALNNGTADMGYFIGNMFPGQFLYNELFGTPGIKYGEIAEVDKVVREYTERFHDDGFDAFKIISHYSIGTMGLITIDPVTSITNAKGMSIRTTSNFMPFFIGMGANCVSMGAGDVYEAIKTNVINGTVTGLNGLATYNLGEVCNSVTPLYMLNGEEMVVMSRGAYEYLPADLQAVVDEAALEMDSVLTEYTQYEQDGALDAAKASNPDFKVLTLSAEAEAAFMDAAQTLLSDKAAELDNAGLDGSGALEWLKAQQ